MLLKASGSLITVSAGAQAARAPMLSRAWSPHFTLTDVEEWNALDWLVGNIDLTTSADVYERLCRQAAQSRELRQLQAAVQGMQLELKRLKLRQQLIVAALAGTAVVAIAATACYFVRKLWGQRREDEEGALDTFIN